MYRVFGYDDMCRDFDFRFDSFVKAVKELKYRNDHMCIAFMVRTGEPKSCSHVAFI